MARNIELPAIPPAFAPLAIPLLVDSFIVVPFFTNLNLAHSYAKVKIRFRQAGQLIL